jgi:hypothetical protein
VDECKPLQAGEADGDDQRVRGDARGKAEQVDPIKPMLKPPGTQHLKLKCDGLLSSFAFNINLRRYNVGARKQIDNRLKERGAIEDEKLRYWVGRCRLTLSNPR